MGAQTWLRLKEEYPCFGEWERGDTTCLKCPEEYSCQEYQELKDQKKKKKKKPKPRKKNQTWYFDPYDMHDDTPPETAIVPMTHYRTARRTIRPLPHEDESWWERVLKNIMAGMLAGVGHEVGGFFEVFAWPFKKKEKGEKEEKTKEKKEESSPPEPAAVTLNDEILDRLDSLGVEMKGMRNRLRSIEEDLDDEYDDD